MMMAMIVPMASSLGDNATGLLIAVFGGAASSLAAGYFARPKTKGEAAAANATADVTMSGDAREWANFWAQKAQEAESKNAACEEKADAAEKRTEQVEKDRNDLVDYIRVLEAEMERTDTRLPPISVRLRNIITNPVDF